MLADEMEDRALVSFVPEDNNDNYRFSLIEITLEVKDDSARITRNYSNPRRYSYFLGKGIAYYTPNKYLNEKRPCCQCRRFAQSFLCRGAYKGILSGVERLVCLGH